MTFQPIFTIITPVLAKFSHLKKKEEWQMRDFTDWAIAYLRRQGVDVSHRSDSDLCQTAYAMLKEKEPIMAYQIFFNLPHTQWEKEHWFQLRTDVGYEKLLGNSIAFVGFAKFRIFEAPNLA